MAPLVWYFLGLCASLLSCFAHAATITYDFNITWVSRNPDGQFDRPTIGINGQWPLPEIRSQVGDRVVITVNNQLGNQSTSLHFHGLFMNGTGEMDGAVGVNQCRIPPGGSFIYNFTVFPTLLYLVGPYSNSRYRRSSQGHIGTIPMATGNTQMGYGAP